ncbi:acyltransferase family protein [Cupriavidus lacunae]|uniref:Acyltransferase n=1 Tax=Cupriavidus lacunae TaxID=2666307 RepID=A0A370P0M9_9BURK|nr:acyltransferase [Cupriavidus lacunae]RDK11328.1 acyltransferase [Cupriavidus lacunae]
MKENLPGLDCLRFSLACYLVLFHTLLGYPGVETIPLAGIFKFGGYVTSTFFILSGFILAHVYVGASTDKELRVPASVFIFNRFFNIYPIHIITLLLTVGLMALGSHIYDVDLSWVDSTPPPRYTMSPVELAVNLIMQVTLLQAWNPFYATFNIPAWSLSTLFFFYLSFPLLAPRLLRMRRKYAVLLAMWAACLLPALAVALFASGEPWAIGTLHTNPLVRLPEFLAGIVAYGIFTEDDARITCFVARHRCVEILMLAAIFIGAAYLFANGSLFLRVLLHNGIMMPTQIALILVCASMLREASQRTVNWARRLGNASLSIFAIQWPLFILFIKIQKALEIPYPLLSCVHRVHECVQAVNAAPPRLYYYPAYLLVTLLVSVVFQERVIVPLRNILRRMSGRQQRVTAPSAPLVSQPASNARVKEADVS